MFTEGELEGKSVNCTDFGVKTGVVQSFSRKLMILNRFFYIINEDFAPILAEAADVYVHYSSEWRSITERSSSSLSPSLSLFLPQSLISYFSIYFLACSRRSFFLLS